MGAAEDVDDIDGLGDIFQAWIGFGAEHFPFVGIDGNHAVTDGLQVGRDFMTGTGGVRGKANDGNGFCLAEKIEDGIGGRWEVVGEIDFHGRWLDAESWESGAERFFGR